MKRYILVALVAGFFGVSVLAQESFQEMGADVPSVDQMVKYLKLSDDQIERITRIREDTEKNLIKYRAELRVLRIELRSELRKNVPDEKKVNAKIDELTDRHKKILKTQINLRLDMNKILTDDQRNQFRKLMITHMSDYKKEARKRLNRRFQESEDSMETSEPAQ